MPEFFGENQGWEGKKSNWRPSVKWPRFTKEGFKKVKIPDDIYADIMEHYSRCKFGEEINDERGFDEDYGEYVVGGSIAVRFAKNQKRCIIRGLHYHKILFKNGVSNYNH